MAALCAMFFTLLKAGDHLVASKFVFGNTNSVFGTLADLGVQVTTVDATDAAQVQAAVRPNTRMVFVETIANPARKCPTWKALAPCAATRGLLYVVDNTVASPYLFRPATVGAGLVMNSLTKSIGGHGDALGGAITDTGLFDWASYPNIFEAYRSSDPRAGACSRCAKKGLRDMGGTPGFTQRPPDRCGGRNPGPAHGPHQRHRAGAGAVAGATPIRGQGALPAAAIAPAIRARPQALQRQARGCCRLS